jgi:hypothetical protein
MAISEHELRTMVRDAIARNGSAGETAVEPRQSLSMSGPHPSHGKLLLVGGGDTEGHCLIEPAVACTHCGYCQSMGH